MRTFFNYLRDVLIKKSHPENVIHLYVGILYNFLSIHHYLMALILNP